MPTTTPNGRLATAYVGLLVVVAVAPCEGLDRVGHEFWVKFAKSQGSLVSHLVARLACDAHLTHLLLDPHGIIVDLGRTQRLFTTTQRRLLAARDGGCRWPDCGRPPAHTDAHHIVSWLDGGPTNVANALLLCRHHHRLTHEGGWRLHIDDPQRGGNGPVHIEGPHRQQLTSHPRAP